MAVGIVAALVVLRPPAGKQGQEIGDLESSVAFEGELDREVLAA